MALARTDCVRGYQCDVQNTRAVKKMLAEHAAAGMTTRAGSCAAQLAAVHPCGAHLGTFF